MLPGLHAHHLRDPLRGALRDHAPGPARRPPGPIPVPSPSTSRSRKRCACKRHVPEAGEFGLARDDGLVPRTGPAAGGIERMIPAGTTLEAAVAWVMRDAALILSGASAIGGLRLTGKPLPRLPAEGQHRSLLVLGVAHQHRPARRPRPPRSPRRCRRLAGLTPGRVHAPQLLSRSGPRRPARQRFGTQRSNVRMTLATVWESRVVSPSSGDSK